MDREKDCFEEDRMFAILFKFTAKTVNFACKDMLFRPTTWHDLARESFSFPRFSILDKLWFCKA